MAAEKKSNKTVVKLLLLVSIAYLGLKNYPSIDNFFIVNGDIDHSKSVNSVLVLEKVNIDNQNNSLNEAIALVKKYNNYASIKKFILPKNRYNELEPIIKKSKHAKIWYETKDDKNYIKQLQLDGVIVMKYERWKNLWILIVMLLLAFWGFFLIKKEGAEYYELLYKRYDNDNLRKIADNIRKEYKENVKALNSKKYTKEEKKEHIDKLRKKYTLILQQKILDYKIQENLDYIKGLIDEGIISYEVDLDEQKEVIKNDLLNNWYKKGNGSLKCPDCGARISEKSIVCCECGIVLH